MNSKFRLFTIINQYWKCLPT